MTDYLTNSIAGRFQPLILETLRNEVLSGETRTEVLADNLKKQVLLVLRDGAAKGAEEVRLVLAAAIDSVDWPGIVAAHLPQVLEAEKVRVLRDFRAQVRTMAYFMSADQVFEVVREVLIAPEPPE